jgi:hypothetical protein
MLVAAEPLVVLAAIIVLILLLVVGIIVIVSAAAEVGIIISSLVIMLFIMMMKTINVNRDYFGASDIANSFQINIHIRGHITILPLILRTLKAINAYIVRYYKIRPT